MMETAYPGMQDYSVLQDAKRLSFALKLKQVYVELGDFHALSIHKSVLTACEHTF